MKSKFLNLTKARAGVGWVGVLVGVNTLMHQTLARLLTPPLQNFQEI